MTISRYDDIIDSRDVIERLDELQTIVDTPGDSLTHEEEEERVALQVLTQEAQSSPDWEYGEALIRDSYFEEYAREYAEDVLGYSPQLLGLVQVLRDRGPRRILDAWPMTCIDWARAAEELQVDYFDVEFDGVTYWVRA